MAVTRPGGDDGGAQEKFINEYFDPSAPTAATPQQCLEGLADMADARNICLITASGGIGVILSLPKKMKQPNHKHSGKVAAIENVLVHVNGKIAYIDIVHVEENLFEIVEVTVAEADEIKAAFEDDPTLERMEPPQGTRSSLKVKVRKAVRIPHDQVGKLFQHCTDGDREGITPRAFWTEIYPQFSDEEKEECEYLIQYFQALATKDKAGGDKSAAEVDDLPPVLRMDNELGKLMYERLYQLIPELRSGGINASINQRRNEFTPSWYRRFVDVFDERRDEDTKLFYSCDIDYSSIESTELCDLISSDSRRLPLAMLVTWKGRARAYICPMKWRFFYSFITDGQYDGKIIAFDGELIYGHANYAVLHEELFDKTLEVIAHTAEYIYSKYANDDELVRLGPHTVDDEGMETICTRQMCCIPHFLVKYFLAEKDGVTVRHFWTVIYPIIKSEDKLNKHECKELIKYFQVLSTAASDGETISVAESTTELEEGEMGKDERVINEMVNRLDEMFPMSAANVVSIHKYAFDPEITKISECCASCGKVAADDIKLQKCPACDLVSYCSDKCRQNHQLKHKAICKDRVALLRDEVVFRQPESNHLGDCPICCLPMPLPTNVSDYRDRVFTLECCCKVICHGCFFASTIASAQRDFDARRQPRPGCPFCRKPMFQSEEQKYENYVERAKVNDPIALREIALIPPFHQTALESMTKAAELGDAEAHFLLSKLYEKGEDVEKDDVKMVYHMEEASIAGHARARCCLALFESKRGRDDRALIHSIIVAKLGHAIALPTVKEFYKIGAVSKEEFASTLRAHHEAVQATKSTQREEAEDLSADDLSVLF